MTPALAQIFAASEATWPEVRRWAVGPFTLRDGKGGGQRVCSATVHGAFGDSDLTAAEDAMRQDGRRPQFQVRQGDNALAAALAARGYPKTDETVVYSLPIARLTDRAIPRVTTFCIWEPLAIMQEIWATDGIDAARLAVMDRAAVKTAILARWNEKPAGVAFVGLHANIAMLHSLVVLPHQRRQGVADWIMRQAAFWGQDQGADHIAVLCVAANTGANAFYRALGFEERGRYHYRIAPTGE